MSAPSREYLSQWNSALSAYDEGRFETALELFQTISGPLTYVLYNSAVIYCRLDRLDLATEKLTEAIDKDPYLAIAFYRRGCIRFLQKSYQEAMNDFESCGRLFRSQHIDYTQMGLAARLVLSDVICNTGICSFLSGKQLAGMELLQKAKQESERRPSLTIDKTLNTLQNPEGDFNPSLITLPDSAPLFRPFKTPPAQKEKSFLGQQKLIASRHTEQTATLHNEKVKKTGEIEICNVPLSQDEESLSIPPPPVVPPPRRPDS